MRYEVDPHNRLIVRKEEKKSKVSRFRHVIEGRFRIGKDNTLLYHIKAPSPDPAGVPHQLKLKGSWSLADDHNLKLTLNKWGRQTFGDEITLTGNIIKADSHSLLFSVTQRTKENASSTHILRFEGNWQADKNNRLTFRIKKEKKRYDVLVFNGIWEINRKNQIVYSYTRGKKRHSLLIKGRWDYSRKGILTYDLDLKGSSHFDFKVGGGIAKKGLIIFETGVGISRRAMPVKKQIILYGCWRIRKKIGLIFEMRHDGSRPEILKFEAEARLAGRSKIIFTLKDEAGKGLGLSLTISRTMLKGCGESFIRILRSAKEQAVYIGAGFTW
ncbi:MAG: hypothetical protein ISS26_04750 [Candidatus Omnitrophica bacterium]|nr:hypothetical protein [Candidatus Omnitrophota bacterium]